MTQEQADKLVQSIYDGIFDSVTKAEPGGKPLSPASSTLLSLAKPAISINYGDYHNPWTPGNSGGSIPAAINTVDLVDNALKLNGLYTKSLNSISKVYGQILTGVNIPFQGPENPYVIAAQKQIDAAYGFLWRTIEETDSETGAVTTRDVRSVLYQAYVDNELAYRNAQAAYNMAYQEAQKTATGRSTWPFIAPSLQTPVKQAYDQWRSQKADLVEQNLAIMNTSTANALQKVFDKAIKLFEGYGAIDLEGPGTGTIHRVRLTPSDWYSVRSASTWITKDISTNNYSTSSTSEYTKYGGSAGFSLGIFSIGGSGGHSTEHRHISTETNNLRFTFSHKLVQIQYPWMMRELFATKGWNLGNLYSRGQVSRGTKTNQDASVMPVIPTSFVVAKDVKISANWSKSDWDFIKKQTSAGGGLGIGPFRIGGSYAHSESKFTSSFNDATGQITVPGLHIIGWISQVVPYCPPAPNA